MKIINTILLILICNDVFSKPSLKFNWGEDKAVVTETFYQNKGSALKFKYKIHLKKVKNGYVLNQSNIRVISFLGQNLRGSTLEKEIKNMVMLPKIKIDENGQYISIIDKKKFIKKYIKSSNKLDKEKYSIPDNQDLLINESLKKWCYWVCLWTKYQMPDSNTVEDTEQISFLNSLMNQQMLIQNHGKFESHSELIKLTYDSLVTVEEPNKYYDEYSEMFYIKTKPDEENEKLSDGFRKIQVVAYTDNETLKPLEVISILEISVIGKRKYKRTWQHVFEFEWR